MKFKRVFLLVLDSLGVGEATDAATYNDQGSNTFKHIMEKYDLFIPNLKKLGFVNTINMSENKDVEAYYTIARPTNIGKDSLTGHYELMGIRNTVPFRTFTGGFPLELLQQIEVVTGRRIIGNKVGSGEKIINEFGERHLQYHALIVYTSSDSTLQVAAHEDIVPIPKLFSYCEKIREVTQEGDYRIARIIARPFTGRPGKFKFCDERRDYAIKPPTKSVMDSLKEHDYNVISIGKVSDIFDGQGITKVVKSSFTNMDTITKLTDIMTKKFSGLCFINLSDFDALYGHNRNPEGYAKGVEEFDVEIPLILNKLENDDLLIITADHGCDPTFQGTAHTRENVPVIIYSRMFKKPKRLDILRSMADIGATIADNFEVEKPSIGESFLDKLI